MQRRVPYLQITTYPKKKTSGRFFFCVFEYLLHFALRASRTWLKERLGVLVRFDKGEWGGGGLTICFCRDFFFFFCLVGWGEIESTGPLIEGVRTVSLFLSVGVEKVGAWGYINILVV